MKSLSLSQAMRCEEATTDRCRCRCGGMFHGSKRSQVTDVPAEKFFEALPIDDPHHANEPKQKRKRSHGSSP